MSIDVETQVLGSMLLSAAAIDDVTETIDGTDYANPRHELIHDTITRLASLGEPVDALSVADTLAKSKGDLARAGGREYLHGCVAAVATPASAGYHAQVVLAASMRRKVSQAGRRLAEIAEYDGDPLDIVNDARAELDAITVDRGGQVSNEQAVYDAVESLETAIGDPTPWGRLSRLISGWSPGMLYIAGARPGIGKTVLGTGALLDIARRGKTGLMFSMEMPSKELYLRMLSAVGSVDGEAVQHRTLTQADHQKMAQAAASIAALPLVVDERSQLSLAQIRAKVRATQRRSDVGLVVVDYLGLVKPPADAPRNDRRVQVDAIAQGLKNLARDVRVPILALAQLNRGIEGRAEKLPTLADLRESGGIEAAADVVMLMHRDVAQDPHDLQIVVPKNRHGPQARLSLTFEGAYSRITEPQFANLRSV